MKALNPWLLLGIGILWLSSLVAVGYWQRQDGTTVERSAWQERDSTALREANAKILTLEKDAREKEGAHQLALNAIVTTTAKEIQDVKDQRDRDIAAAYRGALRLRYQNTPSLNSGGRAIRPPVSATAGGDDSATGELPGKVAADLLALIGDADATALRLTAAQKVIREYYALCGATSR